MTFDLDENGKVIPPRGIGLLFCSILSALPAAIFLGSMFGGLCTRGNGTGLSVGSCFGRAAIFYLTWPFAIALFIAALVLLRCGGNRWRSNAALSAWISCVPALSVPFIFALAAVGLIK